MGRIPPVTIACTAVAVLLGVGMDAGSRERDRPDLPVVDDSSVAIPSTDRAHVLVGRRLSFPGKVSFAVYDSASGAVVARYDAGTATRKTRMRAEKVTKSAVAAYDLTSGATRWVIETEAWPVGICRDRLLLAGTDKDERSLHDLRDGRQVRELTAGALLYRDDCALLTLNARQVARHSAEDGGIVWRRELHLGSDDPRVFLMGDTLMIVGEGLMLGSLRTGHFWEYPVPAKRRHTASTKIRNVLTMAMGLLSLSPIVPREWGDSTIDFWSIALDSAHVYFAADTVVLALDRGTGRFRWKHVMQPDDWTARQARAFGMSSIPLMPGRLIASRRGDQVVLVNCGWTPSKKGSWGADPPAIGLLDAATGGMAGRVRVPGEYVVLAYRNRPEGHYVLTPQEVFRFNDSLRLERRYDHRDRAVWLRGFAPAPDELIVITDNSLLSLAPDSLSVRWRQPLGTGIVWSGPTAGSPQRWAAGSRMLACIPTVDETSGRIVFALPQSYPSFQNGAAVAIHGEAVTVVPLMIRKAP